MPRLPQVRYTANMGFPQCAVYNAEGLPAYPFSMAVRASRSSAGVHDY